MKIVQHEKRATMEIVKHEKGATRKKRNMKRMHNEESSHKKVQHEKCGTWMQHENSEKSEAQRKHKN